MPSSAPPKSSPIYSSLCLICSHHLCELESAHTKYTLQDMEQLLNECVVDEAPRQTVPIVKVLSKTQNNSSGTPQSRNLLGLKNLEQMETKSMMSGPQKIAKEIQELFLKSYGSLAIGKSHLHASSVLCLAKLAFVQKYSESPLLLHDVTEVIKLIILSKLYADVKDSQQIQLPFTSSRVKKLIKAIKKIHEQRARNSKKNNLTQQKPLNKQLSTAFHDRTIRNNNVTVCQNCFPAEKSSETDHQQGCFPIRKWSDETECSETHDNETSHKPGLNEILEYTSFEWKIRQRLFKLQSSHYDFQRVDRELYEYVSYLADEVQDEYFSKLSAFQNQKIETKSFEHFTGSEGFTQEVSNNYEQFNVNSNPQKLLATNSNSKQRQITLHQEESVYLQMIEIEEVPFPSDRRDIDFSVLELDDDMLLRYTPALEKFRNLEAVCLKGCKLTLNGFILLKNAVPKIRSLDLSDTELSKEVVDLICSSFKGLNILQISDCRISVTSLMNLCFGLPNVMLLHCDRIQFEERETGENQINLKGLLYIMVLNLKRLIFASFKGMFSEKAIKMALKVNSVENDQPETFVGTGLDPVEVQEFKIIMKSMAIIKSRHGVIEL